MYDVLKNRPISNYTDATNDVIGGSVPFGLVGELVPISRTYHRKKSTGVTNCINEGSVHLTVPAGIFICHGEPTVCRFSN